MSGPDDDPLDLEGDWEDLRAIRNRPNDDLGLEDAWEVLRGPLPEGAEGPQRGIVWMGLGREEGWECSYPGYERVSVSLRLDGENMMGLFQPSPHAEFEPVQVTWAGLWFLRRGGRPFYERPISPLSVSPLDTLNMAVSLNDEGGYLASMLRALGLL